MKALIIDIRETSLRAVLSNDGVLEYCRSFDFQPTAALAQPDAAGAHEPAIKHAPAAENPYLIYYDTEVKNPWDLALKQIIKQIRSDINSSIDSTHLIVPSDEVIIETHQLPKMARPDVMKLIGRKISAETKEEFPPFSIIPSTSDQKTETWYSLYIPTSNLRDYRKAFSSCGLRLSSITTPVDAMIDAFRSVREAIFNAYVIFEIQRGFIEAFYISSEGLLYFQRLPYVSSAATQALSAEEAGKSQKLKIFKIINTIFSVNSSYQAAHPSIPVQMAWVCGLESGLDDIATALKDAMGIEVGIAPVMPTGLPEESGYVPLAGFASSLLNGTATVYTAADFFKRFPLRKTSGIIIYTLTTATAVLAFTLTERDYRKIRTQVKQVQQVVDSKQNKAKAAASAEYAKNLEAVNRLTARQFVFYDLFRELANDLPDGVFLENLEFSLKNDKGILNLTAMSRIGEKKSESILLSKFIGMLDHSPTLTDYREPSISVVGKDKERFLKIVVSSEVNPLDTTK